MGFGLWYHHQRLGLRFSLSFGWHVSAFFFSGGTFWRPRFDLSLNREVIVFVRFSKTARSNSKKREDGSLWRVRRFSQKRRWPSIDSRCRFTRTEKYSGEKVIKEPLPVRVPNDQTVSSGVVGRSLCASLLLLVKVFCSLSRSSAACQGLPSAWWIGSLNSIIKCCVLLTVDEYN